MTSHFPLREAAVFSGPMFTHAISNCYASPMLSELCLTHWRKVLNRSMPVSKINIYTVIRGDTQALVLLLSWPVHSESESLGGGERKETRKQYGSTISCIWGEAVDGMRILWRP